MTRPLRVGLTGGIACGKSRVMGRLKAAGFGTIDLDRLAHELMEPGQIAFEEVVAAFGPAILDARGAVDRRALGAVVFRDADARRRLDAIVHPRVREEEARRAARFGGAEVVVTEAALLVEAGMHLRFDRLVVVHCSPETQLRRLAARDGIGEGEARRRLAAQMPIGDKRRFAHLEVDTEGAAEATDARADALAGTLRLAARAAPAPRAVIDRARAIRGLSRGPRRGPRGLDPMVLLEALIQCGGLEMEDLRERLRPSAPRPWYQAARADEGPPEPAALAGPVAAWSLLRAPGDLPFAAAAMASVARLTHPQPQAIGNACTLVQATAAVWSHPTLSCEQILAGLPEWSDQARRWAGAGFEERLGPALAEARGRPAASAGGAFLHAFGDAALAETLLGLDEDHGGAAPEDWGRGFDRLAKAISGQGRG